MRRKGTEKISPLPAATFFYGSPASCVVDIREKRGHQRDSPASIPQKRITHPCCHSSSTRLPLPSLSRIGFTAKSRLTEPLARSGVKKSL